MGFPALLCGHSANLIINTSLTTGRLKEHKITSCMSLPACSSPAPLPCQRRSVWCAREQPGQQCSLNRGILEQREFLPEGIPCQLQPGAIPWGQWPRPIQSPAHKGWGQTETLPSERAPAQGDSSLRLSLGRAQAGGRGGECGVAQVWRITAIKAH